MGLVALRMKRVDIKVLREACHCNGLSSASPTVPGGEEDVSPCSWERGAMSSQQP